MDFVELVGATAIGAAVPIVVVRLLDRRAKRREADALSKTGMGRYMNQALANMDKIAGELADKRESADG